MLNAIVANGFDPRTQVILETNPNPTPDRTGRPGMVQFNDLDTDRIEITADLPSAQILLVTDAFATGWRATALDSSAPQAKYNVLSADHAFRAIPLAAGHHHLLLEYAPAAFAWGRGITCLALLGWVGAAAWCVRRSKREPHPLPAPSKPSEKWIPVPHYSHTGRRKRSQGH